MSIYKGTQLISGVATPVEAGRNIGQIIQSLLPITDAGLHLLDGTVINGNGIYKAFVDYIKTLDLTASYFTTEANWQATVQQYGVCGKFVYNASANTVRLPKVTGILEGTIDANALGDLVEAGLPNITGTFTNNGHVDNGNRVDVSGAFTFTDTNAWSNNGNAYDGGQYTFDASLSNPIYGNSTTVQPQAIKGYYYIVVATSAKTDIEVDIDNIVTDLNNKVDVSNMVEVPTIIEVSDPSLMPSWYRVYSDGWCEQGGSLPASGQVETIAFLKPFKDRQYSAFKNEGEYSNTNPTHQSVGCFSFMPTTMQTYCPTGATFSRWEAKGYIW